VIDHTIGFVYDGDQIVFQFERSLPSPASGRGAGGEGGANQVTPLTVADLSHRYLWQANAVDQLMADEALSPLPPGEGQGEGSAGYDLSTPGNVVWPLADQQGTIRDLALNEDGVTAIVNHRVYDSYGNLKSETNEAVDCLFGYTGRAYDNTSGLQNNLSRWYDSNVGRWASEDPIGYSETNIKTPAPLDFLSGRIDGKKNPYISETVL
jgi:RHS repeat-associated protein